jgi:hypothetical protein
VGHFLNPKKVEDTALSAITHFYAEAGSGAVAVGMFVLGWVLTKIFLWLLVRARRPWWGLVVYAPLVLAVPMTEGFNPVDLMGAFRIMFLLFVICWVLDMFFMHNVKRLTAEQIRLPVRPRVSDSGR